MTTKTRAKVGDIFNSLELVELGEVVNKNRLGVFKCYCGNTFTSFINNVKKGNTSSCGCHKATCQEVKWESTYLDRGFTKKDQSTPEYLAWKNMRARCYNQKDISYPNYGAIGITVCDRWLESFENFLTDVGPRPNKEYSLDRNNSNGNYEPGNVSWREPAWQARNKGKVKNTTSRYKGVSFEGKKWRARIKGSDGKPVSLGSFGEEIDAAYAVDTFLLGEFGEECPWTNKRLGLLMETQT